MAGFLVKIAIEDTHPPVWRRLLIPEKINFADLHEIIQISFGWRQSCRHDFTFPKKCLRIFSDGDEWGIGRNENDVLVDDYIEQCTFIRYSLDDEWESSLKIILEKKDAEYRERFAKIIKAKGDDCAIADTNEQLKKLVLPERVSNIREGTEWDFNESLDTILQRELEKNELNPRVFAEFISAAANLENGKKKQTAVSSEVSEIGQMVRNWQNLVDEITDDSYKVTSFHPISHIKIVKRTSEKTSFEMLRKLTKREAADYCKYLNLTVSPADAKEEQIVKIAAFLNENPIYYLWQMEIEEAKAFLNICRQADGPVKYNFCTETLYFAIGIGLAEIYVKSNGMQREAEICVAKNTVSLMKNITMQKLKSEVQKLDKVRRDIFPILQMYGMVDFRTLFERCREYIGLKMEEEEFYRFLYWHLKMRDEVQTATCAADKKPYVALKEVDMNRAMSLQITMGVFFLYKVCTKEEQKLWAKGFCQVYDSWHLYADFLVHGCRVEEEVCRLHLRTAFQAVRNGANIKELMELLLKIYTPRSAYEYKEIWEIQISLLMETSVYGLKGHSRQKFRELMGKLPEELRLAPERGLSEEQIKEHSHIYQMSNDIQERLYFVMDKDYREGEKILEKLLEQTRGRNGEMILYAASHYACNGKLKKAYELVSCALKTCSDADGSLKGTLKMLDDMADVADNFEEGFTDNSLFSQVLVKNPKIIGERDDKIISFPQKAEKTYRKEMKKIGRNAPCPCGSGKKYKHCCGRDQSEVHRRN